MGKLFIFLGVLLVLTGLLLIAGPNIKLPFLGRLPGDIIIKKDNLVFYFPITTSLLISILISALFYLINRK